MAIYSYIITRDYGFAPNPFYGICTLATCKPRVRNNAQIGDWVLGFGSGRKGSKYDEQIKQTAKIIAEKLSLSGLCRVDFRLKDDNSFYVTDVSTNPHFIHHSSVNYAFKRKNLTDAQLFHTILELS